MYSYQMTISVYVPPVHELPHAVTLIHSVILWIFLFLGLHNIWGADEGFPHE